MKHSHTTHRLGALVLHQNTIIMPHAEHGFAGYFQVYHHYGIGRIMLVDDAEPWKELVGEITNDYIGVNYGAGETDE